MSVIEKHILQIDLMDQSENDPIEVTQGDYGAVIFRISVTSNGDPVDLTGNSVHMVIDSKANVGVCTIIDNTNGVVEYALTQNNTAIEGDHQFVLELLTNDSRATTQRCKYKVIQDLNS